MAKLPTSTRKTSVDQFLDDVKKLPTRREETNRLVFGLDATASREPMWDLATHLHAELFNTAAKNDLEVQLVYYRGFQEFRASPWTRAPSQLLRTMQQVRCLGGATQITRFLHHLFNEANSSKLRAAVFIGDACEESPNEILTLAGRLGLLQIPVFVFQEGHDIVASRVFQAIASRSGGAHVPFAPGSERELRDLLNAVAQYASYGIDAVSKIKSSIGTRLLKQLKK